MQGVAMEQLQVVSPAGLQALKTISAAPRLADLNGKTIGEVWNGVFKGDITFPVLRRLLQAKYPSVRIVPYTEFHHLPGSDVPEQQREIERGIVAAAREKGCDALITGNGA
jgi:hypothetical protein